MKRQRETKPNTEENMHQGLREVSQDGCPENLLSGDLCIGGFLGSSLATIPIWSAGKQGGQREVLDGNVATHTP